MDTIRRVLFLFLLVFCRGAAVAGRGKDDARVLGLLHLPGSPSRRLFAEAAHNRERHGLFLLFPPRQPLVLVLLVVAFLLARESRRPERPHLLDRVVPVVKLHLIILLIPFRAARVFRRFIRGSRRSRRPSRLGGNGKGGTARDHLHFGTGSFFYCQRRRRRRRWSLVYRPRRLGRLGHLVDVTLDHCVVVVATLPTGSFSLSKRNAYYSGCQCALLSDRTRAKGGNVESVQLNGRH